MRLVEAHGGTSTVLTLGPEAAADQLRDAMAIGIDRAILLETDGSDWDPIATAGSIVEAIQALEAAGERFDLILFGNESADSGGFQVGIRVAHALDRPCVTGVKALEVGDGTASARREAPGGWEVFEVAAAGRRRGPRGDQPAALSLGAGAPAGQEEGDRADLADPAAGRSGADPPRPARRSTSRRQRSSAPARTPRPAWSRSSASWACCERDPRLRRARGRPAGPAQPRDARPGRPARRRVGPAGPRRPGRGRSRRRRRPSSAGSASRRRTSSRTRDSMRTRRGRSPRAWSSWPRPSQPPRSWRPGANGGRRSSPMSAPGRASRWPPTSPTSSPVSGGASHGNAGPAASSRRPGSTVRRTC